MVDRRKIKTMVKKSRYLQWYVSQSFELKKKCSTRQESVLTSNIESRSFVKRNMGNTKSKIRSYYKHFIDGNSPDLGDKKITSPCPSNGDSSESTSSGHHDSATPERSLFGEFERCLYTFKSSFKELKDDLIGTRTMNNDFAKNKHSNKPTPRIVLEKLKITQFNGAFRKNINSEREESCQKKARLHLKRTALDLKHSPPYKKTCYDVGPNKSALPYRLKSILKNPVPVDRINHSPSRKMISFAEAVDIALIDSNGNVVKSSESVPIKYHNNNGVRQFKNRKRRRKPELLRTQVALSEIVRQLKNDRIHGTKRDSSEIPKSNPLPTSSSSLSQIFKGKRLAVLIDPQHMKRRFTATNSKIDHTKSSCSDDQNSTASSTTDQHSRKEKNPRKKINKQKKPSVLGDTALHSQIHKNRNFTTSNLSGIPEGSSSTRSIGNGKASLEPTKHENGDAFTINNDNTKCDELKTIDSKINQVQISETDDTTTVESLGDSPEKCSLNISSSDQVGIENVDTTEPKSVELEKAPKMASLIIGSEIQAPVEQELSVPVVSIGLVTPHSDIDSFVQKSESENLTRDQVPPKPIRFGRMKITSVRLFSCENCDKKFVSLAKLGAHIPVHTSDQLKISEYFSCKKLQSGSLDKNFNDSPVESSIQKVVDDFATPTANKCHHCFQCHREFKNSDNLKRHELAHLMVRSHACGVCDRRFAISSERNKHERSHVEECI